MNKSLKKETLSSSAGWVAALLNFIPGLGTGYIYQRRWRAYWITTGVTAAWISLESMRELGVDPSDPVQVKDETTIFLGLILIAIVTAIEAWLAVKFSQDDNSIST